MKPIPDEATDTAPTLCAAGAARKAPVTAKALSSALTIDLYERKVAFRYLSPSAHKYGAAPGGSRNAPGPARDLSFSLAGRPEHALESFLSMARELPPLDETMVTIGHLADPLLPFSQFNGVLYVIEELLAHRVPSITIRTRSPLVILLMPLLRGASERLSVCIAIETPHDEVARRFTPDLPRPSERLHAARSLATLGVHTVLDVAPIVGRKNAPAKLRHFAELLSGSGCDVQIRSISELLPAGHPLLRQVPRDAALLLEHELCQRARSQPSVEPAGGTVAHSRLRAAS